MSSKTQARLVRLLLVLWPSFMASIVIVGLLFSAFDPMAMRWTDALGEPLSPLAVYTLGFLGIWAAVSVAVAVARSLPEPRVGDGAAAST